MEIGRGIEREGGKMENRERRREGSKGNKREIGIEGVKDRDKGREG